MIHTRLCIIMSNVLLCWEQILFCVINVRMLHLFNSAFNCKFYMFHIATIQKCTISQYLHYFDFPNIAVSQQP